MNLKKIPVQWMIRTASALASGFCVACSSAPSGALEGKVVDGRTGEPVRDAVVLVFWQGYVGVVDTAKRCSHAETTVTNAAGQFHIASLPWPHLGGAHKEWRSAYVYKEGYATLLLDAGRETIHATLAPAAPDRKQRFVRLARDFTEIARQFCGREDGSSGNVYRIHARQLSEMRRIAEIPEQTSAVNEYAIWLREDLVNFTKPIKTITDPATDSQETANSNPKDQFDSAELLK